MYLDRSVQWAERGSRIIPGLTQTLSKGPTQFVQGVCPIYVTHGQGSHVFDVDGNEYIDFPGALGPVVLGYAHPSTINAVSSQLQKGIVFSLMHPLEVEVAEILVDVVPCAEMVRFGKNGSDVTSAAIRLSRAYTNREKIITCGYHGSHDWYLASTTRNSGVPKFNEDLIFSFDHNDDDALERLLIESSSEIAAVIIEPSVGLQMRDGFLHSVRNLTEKYGVVLIFDEVKSGFRVALGGAQEYYGVIPDLACVGKAMANGMPISALVGRRDLMSFFEHVFFSNTFGGETLSLAATKATIGDIGEHHVIEHLWRAGRLLQEGYNAIADKWGLQQITRCEGLAPKSVVNFVDWEAWDRLLLKSVFQQEVVTRGVLFNGEHMLSLSHSDADIDRTLQVYDEAMGVLAGGIELECVDQLLRGRRIQSIF